MLQAVGFGVTARPAGADEPVRYRDYVYPADVALTSQDLAVVPDPDYPGNSIILEPFDAHSQALVDDANVPLQLDELRSNFGKPWSTDGPMEVVDPSPGGNPRAEVPAAAGRVSASAPSGIYNLQNFWSNQEQSIVDLSMVVAKDTAGSRITFAGADNGSNYVFAEFDATSGASGTIEVAIGKRVNGVDTMGAPTAIQIPSNVYSAMADMKVRIHGALVRSVNNGGTFPLTIEVGPGNGSSVYSVGGVEIAADGPFDDDSDVFRLRVGFSLPEGEWADHFRMADPLYARVEFVDDATAPTDRPVMLHVHGGSMSIGSERDDPEIRRDFARRGYVSVSVDYRKRLGIYWNAGDSLAANSHKIVVSPGVGPWELVLEDLPGAATAQANGLPRTADAADLEDAINEQIGSTGTTVDVWRAVDAPVGEYWLSWRAAGGLFPYPTLESDDVSATGYPNLFDQLMASPLCAGSGQRPWAMSSTSDVSTCLVRHFADVRYCAGAHDAAFKSEDEECDGGIAAFAQLVIGGPALDDIQAAVRWLKDGPAEVPGVDAERIFATGASAGGHLSFDLAADPTTPGRPRHDPNAPAPGVPYGGYSNAIAGAAPQSGGFRLLGDGTLPPWSAPVAIFEHDVDNQPVQGSMINHWRAFARDGWSNNGPGALEHDGWCGFGHAQGSYGEIAAFYVSLLAEPNDPATRRGGLVLGTEDVVEPETDPFELDTGRQQLIGSPGEAVPYDQVVGDFDGDGIDDIYWHQPEPALVACDSLWLGTSDGTFRPTPLLDETSAKLEGFSGSAFIRPPAGLSPSLGDFNGDGRDDLLWYASGSPQLVIWQVLDPDPSDDQVALASGTVCQPDTCPVGLPKEILPPNLFTELVVGVPTNFDQAIIGDFGDGDIDGVTEAGYETNASVRLGDDLYLFDESGDDAIVYFGSNVASYPEVVAEYSAALTLSPGFEGSAQTSAYVGNFDGDEWDDVFWFTGGTPSGVDDDAFWYGAKNGGTASAEDAFAEFDDELATSFETIIAGDFADPGGSCPGCDELYLMDLSPSADDSLIFGAGDRQPSSTNADVGFEATDVNRVVLRVGDLDGDHWDDIVFTGRGDDSDGVIAGREDGELALASTPDALSALDGLLDGDDAPLIGQFNGNGGCDMHLVDLDDSGMPDIARRPTRSTGCALLVDHFSGQTSTGVSAHRPNERPALARWLSLLGSAEVTSGAAVFGPSLEQATIDVGRAADYRLRAHIDPDQSEYVRVLLQVEDLDTYTMLRWKASEPPLATGKLRLYRVENGELSLTSLAVSDEVIGNQIVDLEVTLDTTTVGTRVMVRGLIDGHTEFDELIDYTLTGQDAAGAGTGVGFKVNLGTGIAGTRIDHLLVHPIP